MMAKYSEATLKALCDLAESGVVHAEGVEQDTNYDCPTFGPSTAERMRAELENMHEPLADLFIRLSGKRRHASSCATSSAPASMPGPCDCDFQERAS